MRKELEVAVRVGVRYPGFKEAVSDYFWQNQEHYLFSYSVDPEHFGPGDIRITYGGRGTNEQRNEIGEEIQSLFKMFSQQEVAA